MGRIISGLLLALSVYIGISHGSRAFTKPTPTSLQMMSALGINEQYRFVIGVWAILASVLILFPKTFFLGNVLRAVQLVLLIALALKAGNFKFALIEIPFLALPLLLIYLRYPFKGDMLLK